MGGGAHGAIAKMPADGGAGGRTAAAARGPGRGMAALRLMRGAPRRHVQRQEACAGRESTPSRETIAGSVKPQPGTGCVLPSPGMAASLAE